MEFEPSCFSFACNKLKIVLEYYKKSCYDMSTSVK